MILTLKKNGLRHIKICGKKLSAGEEFEELFKILLKEKMSFMILIHDKL